MLIGCCNTMNSNNAMAVGASNTTTCTSMAVGRNNIINCNTGGYAFGCANTANGTASCSMALGHNNSATNGSYAFGYYNTASGYKSSSLGSIDSTSSATYSSTLGKNASAYLYGQNALSSGQFSATGDAQSSTLISRRSAGSLTSGATMTLSLDGTGTTNLIIPPTGKTWALKIQYASRVVGISGTATGVTNNDSKTQTQEIGVKNIGGVTTILSGSPNNGIALEDPSMNTASMSYSVGASNEIVMTFTAPIFAGGGSLTIKAVATLSITEVL
jgi:hypothetical protein